jgi:hypothetical protein
MVLSYPPPAPPVPAFSAPDAVPPYPPCANSVPVTPLIDN